MDKDIRSLKRTVKGFDKLNAQIRKNAMTSSTGRRLRRTVLLVFAALLLVSVLLPPFTFPVNGPVSSGFFLRKRPESHFALAIENHKGIDLAAPAGTPVRSSAPGVVLEAGFSDTYGNFIRVRHLFGFQTRYAHLSEIDVHRGSVIVLRGVRTIGKVGSTGRATGPHLHFEVRWFGVPLPPRFFLLFDGLRKAMLGF